MVGTSNPVRPLLDQSEKTLPPRKWLIGFRRRRNRVSRNDFIPPTSAIALPLLLLFPRMRIKKPQSRFIPGRAWGRNRAWDHPSGIVGDRSRTPSIRFRFDPGNHPADDNFHKSAALFFGEVRHHIRRIILPVLKISKGFAPEVGSANLQDRSRYAFHRPGDSPARLFLALGRSRLRSGSNIARFHRRWNDEGRQEGHRIAQ